MDFHQLDIRRFLLESIPSRFAHLSPQVFADLVRYLFEADGYEVTRPVDTGGFSGILLAKKEEGRIVLLPLHGQAHTSADQAAIKTTAGARAFFDTEYGWLITTSDAGDKLKKAAAKEGIEIWDWEALYQALCDMFFEGKRHDEYYDELTWRAGDTEDLTELKLRVKWEPAEGTGAEWYRLMLVVSNPSSHNLYIHFDLPAFIDSGRNQVMADHWADDAFVSGMLYAGASVRTYALFSVDKAGDRPPGGRVVLTCHERRETPLTRHLQARLKGEACFVVTYCYSRQSDEYRSMIRYRDDVLVRNWYGRCVIAIYYKVSPLVVAWASRNRKADVVLRRLTRQLIGWFS